MGKLKIEHYVVGMVQTNCYIASHTDTKECFIVDPGASASQLTEKIRSNGYQPVAILLTHGHFDHAGAASQLAKEFGVETYAHEEEKETLTDADKNLSGWGGQQESYSADIFLRDGQEVSLAGFKLRILHTPGHTTGGCCYYLPDEDVLFSGDTLFAQSVGRTDFPGGSMSQLVRSIKEKLLVLPEHTSVYPGHNEVTSIKAERMYNPYL